MMSKSINSVWFGIEHGGPSQSRESRTTFTFILHFIYLPQR
jgi:hypothetical protein